MERTLTAAAVFILTSVKTVNLVSAEFCCTIQNVKAASNKLTSEVFNYILVFAPGIDLPTNLAQIELLQS